MRIATVVAAAGLALALAGAAVAQPFDVDLNMQGEIAAANDALNHAHQNLGGMDGIGTIPEPDLGMIHELLGTGERLLRDARRRAQTATTPQDEIWAVGHARAAKAMIEAAFEYKTKRGYQ